MEQGLSYFYPRIEQGTWSHALKIRFGDFGSSSHLRRLPTKTNTGSQSNRIEIPHWTYGNIEVGRQILKQLLVMEPYNSGLYVFLSNIYCEVVRWKDVKKIRKLMDGCGIKNCRAISLIEIDGCVREFLVDDKRHEIWSSIRSMLDQLTQHLKFS
ncbi:hypothetical protein I3760_10G045600 [Carya illinoinensis]|nr:hypothetical protein I3760_10G045600 [Carya illinoinensis]